jgi:UDP-N-acetylmuramoylalanine--D-glutamate ligase
MNFRNQRVTVMGLGHFGGGVAAARWLARQGAVVTVTDTADAPALADALGALQGEAIAAFHLGGHVEADFRHVDLLVVNPAVRPENPYLQIARESSVRVTSEIELFLDACPARIVGVTGSNGKSTTAAMAAALLGFCCGESFCPWGRLPACRSSGRLATCPTPHPRSWLGGNIGGSLLDRLDEIAPDDWVVLELSSFQLWHLSAAARMPHVAIVTGCTPNHLDWHGSLAHYAAAKQRILAGQSPGDFAVLNMHDAEVSTWQPFVRGRCVPPVPLADIPPLAVPGEHNRVNAACAAAAALAVGCDAEAVDRGLRAFHGLPQRLELFATIDGRRFYNDSTATTPESTIAALDALEEPIWLLAGGRSKGFDFGPLAAAITARARGAALFGAVRDELQAAVAARMNGFPCMATESLDEALAWCWQQSRPGDAIVLSSACASTDQFRNFRHRGERFAELVSELGKHATS